MIAASRPVQRPTDARLLVIGGRGAIAHALADHGARIVIADVNLEAAQAVAQSCERAGTSGPLAVHVDITRAELVNTAVEAIEAETERIAPGPRPTPAAAG